MIDIQSDDENNTIKDEKSGVVLIEFCFLCALYKSNYMPLLLKNLK